MRSRRARRGAAAAVAASLALVPAALGSPPAAGQQPYEAGASNMGMCSAFLASLPAPVGSGNARAFVNHAIQDNPGLFDGARSPGDLYSVRAKQRENLPPPLECLKRS